MATSNIEPLGCLQLVSEAVIPPEVLADLEIRVTQAGLHVHRSRSFVRQEGGPTGAHLNQLVEVVATFDSLSDEEWNRLTAAIVEDYSTGKDMRYRFWKALTKDQLEDLGPRFFKAPLRALEQNNA